MSDAKQTSFEDMFSSMLRALPNAEYYALTILCENGPEGSITWLAHSHWTGFTEDNPKREIRAASLVRPDIALENWRTLGMRGLVVNSDLDLVRWMHFGGHALVKREIAESHLVDWIAPTPAGSRASGGFATLDSLPPSTLQHAPSPKHRMRILKRDSQRCRICGRSPSTNVDVELHVHHIRPFGAGGLTEDDNLITLCHTCHKGLDPHHDLSLFLYVNPQWPLPPDDCQDAHWNGVLAYQQKMRILLAAESTREDDEE